MRLKLVLGACIFATAVSAAQATLRSSTPAVTSELISATASPPSIESSRYLSGDGRYLLYQDSDDGRVHVRDLENDTAQTVYQFNTYASMSESGRYVVHSEPGGTYVWDRTTGASQKVADGWDYGHAVADDPRYVAYEAVSPDQQAIYLYFHDGSTGTTTLISRDSGGVPGGGNSPSISADGATVVFNGPDGATAWNRATDTLTLLSTNTMFLAAPDVSGDGRFAASAGFTSDGTNAIFLTDLTTSTTSPVWTDTPSERVAGRPSISDDGRYVVFTLEAIDAQGNSSGESRVVRLDTETNDLLTVSIDPTGQPLTNISGGAVGPDINSDGSKIVIPTDAGLYLVTIGDGSTTTPLAIDGVHQLTGSVAKYGRFEASIDLNQTFAHPFDPDQIAIDVTFDGPNGSRSTVPAFWYQPFTASGADFENYTPTGDPEWRVRFAPDQPGTWTYTVQAHAGAGDAAPVTGTFDVSNSSSKGFVSADADFLKYADGSTYMPIGHDVAFEDGNPNLNGTAYYGSLFSSLKAAGENWTRVWMTDFNRSALEWSSGHWSGLYGGVGTYSLASAWRMDKILDLAQQDGIEVQLTLNDHGQFSTHVNARWNENPYNAANGGPVPADDPGAFFSDATSEKLFQQRLRYLIARYGAYTSLLDWELFNEVQFVGTDTTNPYTDTDLRDAITNWHSTMGRYLHDNDPYGHPVTTSSYDDPTTSDIFASDDIDLIQLHSYGTPNDTSLPDQIDQLRFDLRKPVLAGEVGIGSGDPENGFDPTTYTGTQANREHLTEGTHLHNTAWSAALAGSVAGYWWWGTYISSDAAHHRGAPTFPLNEGQFPALAKYLKGENWDAISPTPARLGTPASLVANGLETGDHAYLWVRDAQNEFGTGARPGDLAGRTISGQTLTLFGLRDGMYRVDIYGTWGAGGVVSNVTADSTAGTMPIQLPPFTRDIALKISPLPDSDGDGIPDAWETNGIDADGNGTIDLHLNAAPYNADPRHKDLFVEADWMAGFAPQSGTLPDVQAAFTNAPVDNPDGTTGIRLHAMLDEQTPLVSPILFASRGPGATDDFEDLKLGGPAPCDGTFGTAAERTGANCGAVLAAKRLVFRYALFGQSYAENPTSSGISEMPGNDFMVTLGGKSSDWIASAGSLEAAEAGTFMHELGHTLGIHHGGGDDVNCKPNYQSVMNYTLQVPYIVPDRPLDYSRTELDAFDENLLSEPYGAGAATGTVVYGVNGQALTVPADGPVDWNGDGVISAPDDFVSADPNWITSRPGGAALPGCGPSPGEVLIGHDDWTNLNYDFRGSPSFANGVHTGTPQLISKELTSTVALDVAQHLDSDHDGIPNAADHPIVFASSRTGFGDIYSVDPSGGSTKRLTTSNAIDSDPSWSPNRTKIVFTSTRDGNFELYTMNADGTGVVRLTKDAHSDLAAAWSPDGTKIAFASDRTSGNWDIYVMNANGTGVTRLTTPAGSDLAPTWSPDGTKIAFASARTGNGDIYVMNANGGSQTRLTTSTGIDTEPDWAGTTIAFSSNRDGSANFELYTMTQTGTTQTRRTNRVGVDGGPSWSPDGTKLAFVTGRYGASNVELGTINASGTGETRLTNAPGLDAAPDW